MDRVRIRVLQGVSGTDFSWAPGSEIELPQEEAAKWADGVRAELVDDPAVEPEPEPELEEEKLPQEEAAERVDEPAVEPEPKPERAARQSRGGGRAAKPETRG